MGKPITPLLPLNAINARVKCPNVATRLIITSFRCMYLTLTGLALPLSRIWGEMKYNEN